MEVSGTVRQRVSSIYGAGTDRLSFHRKLASCGSVDVGGGGGGACFNRRGRGVRVSLRAGLDSEFSDDGHIQYYQALAPRCGGRDKEKGSAVLTTKKKMKLLKGLYKGLSMASELGFSLDTEKFILEEVQGKLTSDASEVLLKQIEQLKAEEKDVKRQKKQEKAQRKAAMRKTALDCESSSSSSESSDSDCGEVVDMRSLRASTALAQTTTNQLPSAVQEVALLSPPPSPSSLSQGSTANKNLCKLGDTNISSNINFGLKFDDIATITVPQKRIEVCMGNKCKKSGAPALLQEFERVVGTEGAVIGCKCMGKCKAGPNVRVQNSVDEGLTDGLNDDSVMIPANPLYIGVSLEDVDSIVSRLLGENQSDTASAAAAAAR